MSWMQAETPECARRDDAVELVIAARQRDLGGFCVRRVLPSPQRRMVGPFIFFDEMGPADFAAGTGLDVRPHPHIGLSTVTWLFEGEILHRDSLGVVQPVQPGAMNLMTAGRGIVHSERSPDAARAAGSRLHGIQTWMALPDGLQECEPAFQHVAAAELPDFAADGITGTVLMGAAYGRHSPVETPIATLYVAARMAAGARAEVPPADEVAVFVVDGEARIGGCTLAAGSMGVLRTGAHATIEAVAATRLMIIGGASPGRREVWWNFVASDAARIERARADWTADRFPRVPGEHERIPLPGA